MQEKLTEKLTKGPVVLYEQMRLKILETIRKRELQPHDPVPSESEFARLYGVSTRTSKEALLQLAREGIVYRLPRRGTFLAKLPENSLESGEAAKASEWSDRSVGSLRLGSRPAIGVLLPDPDEYVGRVLQALTNELTRCNLEPLVRFTSGRLEREDELARELVDEYGVAGLIVYPGRHDALSDLLMQLHMREFPIVFVDRAFREINIPSVFHDHLQGARELTAYLIGVGHRRIGFASEDFHGVMSREDRFNGYTQAFLEASLSLDLSLVHMLDGRGGRTTGEDAAQGKDLDDFIAGNPDMTAVICSNDYVALVVMQSAYRLGVTVPDRLSVTGFTDLSFAALLPVPLTTVEKNAPELGLAAARMLTELIADPSTRRQPLVIPTQLKERASVRPLV